MSTLHIYTASWQPATRWRLVGDRRWIRWPERALVRCHRCDRLRWAKNAEVQVFYDKVNQRCGGGCARRRKVGR